MQEKMIKPATIYIAPENNPLNHGFSLGWRTLKNAAKQMHITLVAWLKTGIISSLTRPNLKSNASANIKKIVNEDAHKTALKIGVIPFFNDLFFDFILAMNILQKLAVYI